jgi:endonuclease G
MGSGGTNTVIHNPFVVPEEGTLHFNLHAPEKPKGNLRILMKRPQDNMFQTLTDISLNEAEGTPGEYGRDLKRVDYGFSGFETFQVDIPAKYRRGAGLALLKFEFNPVGSATIYLDDIAFKSPHLKFGNPSEAKFNPDAPNFNNLLLEKPQYALSYNSGELRPNWASWQVNKSWISNDRNRPDVFIADPQLPAGITKVDGSYYEDEGGDSLGYDRGQMAPARDRSRNKKDKMATFLGTNIVPQSVDNNRFFPSEPTDNIIHASAWNNIENYVTKLVNNGNELYVAAGSAGTNWEPQKQSNVFDELRDLYTDSETFQERGIHIPEWTWKAILVLDTPGLDVQDVIDNPSRAKTYAFITPNVAEPFEDWNKKTIPHPLNPLLSEDRGDITTKREWRSPETWQVSVNELETILKDSYSTPLDFISQIPDSIGNNLKNNKGPINI